MSWADRRYGSGGGGVAFPPLTSGIKTLLFINLAVCLADLGLGGKLGSWMALSAPGLLDGFGLGLVRIITYQFVHSFQDPWHLLFNMLMLYLFGTFVEQQIGRRRVIRLYLLSGVVGGVLFMLMGGVTGRFPSVVGASGCVFGIVVYTAFIAPRMTVWLFGLIPIRLWLLVAVMVFLALASSAQELHGLNTGAVAHGAHLGGAIWGFAAFKVDRSTIDLSRFKPLAKLARMGQQRRIDAARKRQAVLDQILEKVHREGLGALTSAERRFLDRASKDMNR